MRDLSFSLLKNISFLNDASLMGFRWDFKEFAELEKHKAGFDPKMCICANQEQNNQRIKIKSLLKGLLNMKEVFKRANEFFKSDFKKPLLESKRFKAQKSNQIQSEVIAFLQGKHLPQAREFFQRSSLIKKVGFIKKADLFKERLKQKSHQRRTLFTRSHQNSNLLDGGIQNQVDFLGALAQEARRS